MLTFGVVVAFVGLLKPSAVRPLYVGMMIASFPAGWLISHLILATVYFTLFTPLALFFRLMGRDSLRLSTSSACPTYLDARPAPGDKRSYFRPF